MSLLVVDKEEFIAHFRTRQVGYNGNFNFEFEDLSDEGLVISVNCDEKTLNPIGSVHGGLLYSIGDHAAGSFAYAIGSNGVTLKGSMDYFYPVEKGRIYAKARLKNRTKRTVLLEVDIIQEDRVVAYGIYNFYIRSPRGDGIDPA